MTDSYPQPVPPKPRILSETRLLLLLAAVQFTHIMDFMVMMPLGPQLMRDLSLTPQQFGNLISVFGITAGLIGLCTAPFMDRFDRRKLLLFCYSGFILGTLACGLSHTPGQLMLARSVCGAFGGVSSAVIMAIVADVVPPERRARGMGIIMTAFSAAAALGVPFGLKLAQWSQWETPFLFIAGIAALAWSMLFRTLPSVRGHLEDGRRVSVRDFLDLLRDGNAWRGITLMIATVWGHFTVIPYLSPFLVRNVGMPEKSLFLVYLVGGLASIVTGPRVGKLADRYGRFRIYVVLVIGACLVIRTLTSSGPLPVWGVLIIAAAFFIFASGRFIPAQAVISLAVPSQRRGAYMSLIGCSRDLAMGVTTVIAGHIITTGPRGELQHFDLLGLLAIGVSIASLWLFLRVRSAE